ncbi:MAG: hypothetical protein JWN42_1390, partial [Candidatus Angelobacter sp.]|nr:hypothetical protein [Candidatus Angelobacter sp.]
SRQREWSLLLGSVLMSVSHRYELIIRDATT